MSNTALYGEYREFLASRRSLFLATVGSDGLADASYAPFVEYERAFFIFISDLTAHTRNLRRNPDASILLAADEQDTEQSYTRLRVSFSCHAEFLSRESPLTQTVLPMFKQKFGPIIDTLTQLADFHMCRLLAKRGTFVKGFGQAYQISGALLDQLTHIVPNVEN